MKLTHAFKELDSGSVGRSQIDERKKRTYKTKVMGVKIEVCINHYVDRKNGMVTSSQGKISNNG